ncbi:MAG: metallophosphoesterase, partial [Calditrichia bacterium]
MKIIAIPDLHGSTAGLQRAAEEIASADVVLLVGDITNFGGAVEATKMIDAVRR